MIRKSTDEERNLTVQTCTGRVSPREIKDAIEAVYAGEPTLNQLWDMTEADVEDVQTENLRAFARLVSEHGHGRRGGKTAIVSPVDLAFGLSRMYSAMADINEQQILVRVFRSLDEANAWIEED
jgi:hypothetical protein